MDSPRKTWTPNVVGRSSRIKAATAALLTSLLATSFSIAEDLPSPVPLSAADAALYERAFAADAQDDWAGARRAASQATDPILRPAIEWIILADGDAQASFSETAAFLATYPNWPSNELVRRRAEERITGAEPAAAILDFFARWEVLTGEGLLAYLGALERSGRQAEIPALLTRTWPEIALSETSLADLNGRYGDRIGRDLHITRLDALLWDGRDDEAEDMLGLVGEDWRLLGTARLRLQRRANGVDAAVQAVPAALRSDPGLIYERMRWRRRAGLRSGAVELLNSMPENAPGARGWWTERYIIARNLFNEGNVQAAYDLVARHKQIEGFPVLQAEWFAGWTSLRFLGRPDLAIGHFERLFNTAETPISLARGAYWIGRTAVALGDRQAANSWFQVAGQYATTFYGQLANDTLGVPTIGVLPTPPTASPEVRGALLADPRLDVSAALHQVGETRRGDAFLWTLLGEYDGDSARLTVLADAAMALSRLQIAVRAGKEVGQADGTVLLGPGWPTLPVPSADQRPPLALVYGLMRQESEFNLQAESWVGALGLMQLMPATAEGVARQLGIPHSRSQLTTDADHNVRLGSTYLGDMLDRYNGAAILAVAAYNAGPGRPDRWLNTLGDPRGRTVEDIVDWIESIPIYETRSYVQRVLESTQVYRYQLRDGTLMGSLTRDLQQIPIR